MNGLCCYQGQRPIENGLSFGIHQLESHSKCKLVIHHWWLHLPTTSHSTYEPFVTGILQHFSYQSKPPTIPLGWLNVFFFFLSVTQGGWLKLSNISLEANKRSWNQISLVLLSLAVMQSRITDQEAVILLAKHCQVQTLEKCDCRRAGTNVILSISFFLYGI